MAPKAISGRPPVAVATRRYTPVGWTAWPGSPAPTPRAASTNATGRQPVSVAISPTGTLFVTELYYSLIRQVTNTSYSPVNLSATSPVAVTQPASGIAATNATLNGTVNAGDAMASYYLEWGLTTNYGNFTATNVLATNLTTAEPVSTF